MTSYFADLSSILEYRVRIEFTPPMDPLLLAEGVPFVSLLTEIEANTLTSTAKELRRLYDRIPYSSPLYWWETHSKNDGAVACVYIGQTVHLQVQKRFESHAVVMRLLARYVNSSDITVMFRLCSRLDVIYGSCHHGIEHLPPDQAARVITDVEAYLIYGNQPLLNIQQKHHPKKPWKPFVVEEMRLR
jgi:hypothetical protein